MPLRQWKEIQKVPRRRAKLIVPIFIVGFWLTMTTFLLQREVFVEIAPIQASGPREFDAWMSILAPTSDGDLGRIGFLHTEAKRDFRDDVSGSSLAMVLKFSTTLSSLPMEMLLTGTTWTPDNAGLSEFEFTMQSFDHTFHLAGEIDEGTMNLDFETAGEHYPISFPVGKNLLLSSNFGSTTLNLPSLRVGEEVFVDAFDPITLSRGKARIKCIAEEDLVLEGQTVRAKVLTTTLAGITTKFWVSYEEETLQIVTPFGFTFRKTTPEAAMADLDDTETRGLMDTLSIQPTGLLPHRGAQRMRFRISGLPPAVRPPSDGIQTQLEDDVYEVISGDLVTKGDHAEPTSEDLSGDPFVQVDHPDIREQAAQIVEGATNDAEKARRLYDWVYENVEKTLVLSFPSALEVLESRQGDCNEHTVLYTALARSLEIPTRIAIGVVWSNQLGGFYYHAWPEVYLDAWIPMDPTLGQPAADATHIKLLTGDIETWPRLLPYFGQMNIEVLEIE